MNKHYSLAFGLFFLVAQSLFAQDQDTKSSRTRFLTEPVPDYMDSALVREEKRYSETRREMVLSGFRSLAGGVRVGQSFFSNQPTQIIGQRYEGEITDSAGTVRLIFDSYDLDSEQNTLSTISLIAAGYGLHLRSPSRRSVYGLRLNGGLISGNQNVSYSGNLAFGTDFYFRTYPRTRYFSALFAEFGLLTSRNQLFLDGMAGYSIYLGNYVLCSFVFRQVRTAEKVTSGSLGVMVGLFIPEFEIR